MMFSHIMSDLETILNAVKERHKFRFPLQVGPGDGHHDISSMRTAILSAARNISNLALWGNALSSLVARLCRINRPD